MPAKSQQQLKFIYALRNKYKTKKKAPKKFKWVFDKEWTEDVKMKKLPVTVDANESILSFNEFNKINEAVIEPDDYTEMIESILKKDITLDEVNNIFNKIGVRFADRQEFIDSLQNQEEKENVPPHMGMFPFAAYNYHNDTIYFVIKNESIFLRILNDAINNDFFKSQFINYLNSVLRHEMVHKEQFNRNRSKKMDNLKINPQTKHKEYLSNKLEIMAYARTIVDNLLQTKTKDEILSNLRHGKIKDRMFSEYEKIGGDVFKRLIKYIYMYLEKEN